VKKYVQFIIHFFPFSYLKKNKLSAFSHRVPNQDKVSYERLFGHTLHIIIYEERFSTLHYYQWNRFWGSVVQSVAVTGRNFSAY
jgi:hypothetical protein